MILKINPQVYDDLEDIKNYIAEDSISEAEKVVSNILSDIEKLEDFPEIGAYLGNKITCSLKYRYIITHSYATIYSIENNEVIVLTVLHLARDFSALNLLYM